MGDRLQTSSYIPSLDGFRAFAVMLVVISHAGMGHIVPGGFGVTVFFFLSGYLITILLRVEWEQNGAVSLRNFYIRRAYRIFPPLFVVLVVVGVLTYVGIVGQGRSVALAPVAAQLLFGTNYYAIAFGEDAFLPGTGVLWSLAIEEHFYLVFPVGLLLLLRLRSYSGVVFVLGMACFVALLWRLILVYGFGVSAMYTYMATDARFDSILFGCILALVFNPHLDRNDPFIGRGTKFAALVLALAVLVYCFIQRDVAFRETLRYSLQGMALMPIFWLAIRHSDWKIFRPLNWWISRWLGRISYTVYLFHLTGYNLAALVVVEWLPRTLLGIAITLVFSIGMFYLVEQRFSRLRKRLHNEMLPS